MVPATKESRKGNASLSPRSDLYWWQARRKSRRMFQRPFPFRSRSSQRSPAGMSFHVGPYMYRLNIAGIGCSVHFNTRIILIGRDVVPSRRREALTHELWHAWLFYVPQPKTEEEQAQLVSTSTEAMIVDLEAQGGERALRALSSTADEYPFGPDPAMARQKTSFASPTELQESGLVISDLNTLSSINSYMTAYGNEGLRKLLEANMEAVA